MKHTPLLLLLAAAAITACSETDTPVEPPAQPSEPEIETPDFINIGRGFTSMAPVRESETNPTLLTDWENCPTIYLNNGPQEGVPAPWSNETDSDLPNTFCRDIKKSDGWTMLFHTFMNIDNTKEARLAYMCFYNIFTGYVKVLYHTDSHDIFDNALWSVLSDGFPTTSAMLSGCEYFSHPLSGGKNPGVWSITSDHPSAYHNSNTRLNRGWNGFEFRVGEYSPGNADGLLHFLAYNASYNDYIAFDYFMSIRSATASAANAAGLDIVGNFKTSANIQMKGGGASQAFGQFMETRAEANYQGFNGKDIREKLDKGNYADAIAGGLGYAFNALFRDYGSHGFDPDLFIHFAGTVNVQRTGLSPILSSVPHLEVNLKEVLKHQPLDALGVWTLKQRPTVYYDRYTHFTADEPQQQYAAGKTYDLRGTVAYPATVVGDVDIVFNPAIKPYITSYTVSTGIIDVTGGNRDLDNTGKALIAYNPDNLLADYGDIKAYGVSDGARDISGKITLPAGTTIGKDTDLYIDWGTNVGGNRAAVVTLTMNIDYNGRAFTLTESRVYDVTYAPTPADPATFNNPPHTYILNAAPNTPTGFPLHD